jgi:hypothetical protein
MIVDRSLHLLLDIFERMLVGVVLLWLLLLVVCGAGTARSHPQIEWHVVALADATGWESKPVGEDATALVVGIVGEQTVKAELLFAATTVATVHLLVFVGALLPVHVLFERVEVEKGEHFAARVVGPEGSDHFFFDRAGVAGKRKSEIFFKISYKI